MCCPHRRRLGGPGKGLIDNAIGLADQVGVPVPDGDTEKIDKAAQAWDRLATVYQTKTVVEALEVNARRFSDTKSPEVELIGRDLLELRDATKAILDSCAELSKSCNDYRTALDELRNNIGGILEDLAIELGATAAIGIAAFVCHLRRRRGGRHRQGRPHDHQVRQDHRARCCVMEDDEEHRQGCAEDRGHRAKVRKQLERIKNLGKRKGRKGEAHRSRLHRRNFRRMEARKRYECECRREWGHRKTPYTRRGVGQRWEDPFANPVATESGLTRATRTTPAAFPMAATTGIRPSEWTQVI